MKKKMSMIAVTCLLAMSNAFGAKKLEVSFYQYDTMPEETLEEIIIDQIESSGDVELQQNPALSDYKLFISSHTPLKMPGWFYGYNYRAGYTIRITTSGSGKTVFYKEVTDKAGLLDRAMVNADQKMIRAVNTAIRAL